MRLRGLFPGQGNSKHWPLHVCYSARDVVSNDVCFSGDTTELFTQIFARMRHASTYLCKLLEGPTLHMGILTLLRAVKSGQY